MLCLIPYTTTSELYLISKLPVQWIILQYRGKNTGVYYSHLITGFFVLLLLF